MNITFIRHSAFLVETDSAYLLFDDYSKELPELSSDKPLFIFASHKHGDHYNKSIYEWNALDREVHYFLSSDIPTCSEQASCDIYYFDAHEERSLTIDHIPLHIETLRSNDAGIAWIIEIDGQCIYHAGDLNNWWWDGDAEDMALEKIYHEELSRIKSTHFDIAFIPLDHRLADSTKGITDFLNYCSTDALVPMHFDEHFEIIDEFMWTDIYQTVTAQTKFIPLRNHFQTFSVEK